LGSTSRIFPLLQGTWFIAADLCDPDGSRPEITTYELEG